MHHNAAQDKTVLWVYYVYNGEEKVEWLTKKAGCKKMKNKEIASRILRILPYTEAFYFFTGIGQYSGEVAASLSDFRNKIETIDVKSIDFHFKRQDFEKWIRETLGDSELADEISRIRMTVQGEDLRDKIRQALENRLAELKKLLASKESYLKHF
jgi:hypothetical protein